MSEEIPETHFNLEEVNTISLIANCDIFYEFDVNFTGKLSAGSASQTPSIKIFI